MTKLRDKFLNVPLDAVLHPASEFAQQAAKTQQTAAAAAPPVRQRDLTAQEWVEQGLSAVDPDESIRCYTEALRLNPAYAAAYTNRGIALEAKGNMAAVQRANEGDLDGAIEDYTEALRLQPDDAEAYTSRAIALEAKGDMVAAQRDFAEAKRLCNK